MQEHVSQEGSGDARAGWAPSPCPFRTHLLKAGVPLLCRDHKLDPVAHIVLKLPGRRRKGAENWCPLS